MVILSFICQLNHLILFDGYNLRICVENFNERACLWWSGKKNNLKYSINFNAHSNDVLLINVMKFASSCRKRRRKWLLVSMRERPSGPLADPPSSSFLWGACLLLTATDQIWLTKINGRALTSDQFNLATVLARNKRAHCQQGSAHFNAYSIPFTHIVSPI